MSVYIMTHKKFMQPKDYFYKSVLVGAYQGHIFGDYFDDAGEDNISRKNTNYCELTGIYWLWKNRNDDIIGIVHYRRYFSKSFFNNVFLSEKDIRKKLEIYDIILPNRVKLFRKVKEFTNSYDNNMFDRIRSAVQVISPEYLDSFDSVMDGNETYFCNMMICPIKLYREYCSWVFAVLFELEKHVSMEEYSNTQKRLYGYISERLLTVWVHYKNLKICELGIVNTETKDTLAKSILKAIRRKYLFYCKHISIMETGVQKLRKYMHKKGKL